MATTTTEPAELTQSSPAELPPAAAESPGRTFNWRDLEPILKWTAVAYGFGFLTVMIHTWELGIPVLQLIEPLNIWIGAPLALAFFFSNRLVAYLRGEARKLAVDVKAARSLLIAASNPDEADLKPLLDRYIQLVVDSVELIAGPLLLFPLPIVRWLRNPARKWLTRKMETLVQQSQSPGSESARAQKWLRRIVAGLQGFTASQRFTNAFLQVLQLPILCLLYIQFAYPNLPQSVGGAKPMPVTLVFTREDLPRGPQFSDWLPSETPAPPDPLQPNGEETTTTYSIPVMLYLRTENALYVRKGAGPIVSFPEHAVLGVAFDSTQPKSPPKP